MNKYIAYEKNHSSWQQQQLQGLITMEEALASIEGKYWLGTVAAARAVLTGHSSTKYVYISPVKVENRKIKYMFSNDSIY